MTAEKTIQVLIEELEALNGWLMDELPDDVRQGIEISIDKIERVLGE